LIDSPAFQIGAATELYFGSTYVNPLVLLKAGPLKVTKLKFKSPPSRTSSAFLAPTTWEEVLAVRLCVEYPVEPSELSATIGVAEAVYGPVGRELANVIEPLNSTF